MSDNLTLTRQPPPWQDRDYSLPYSSLTGELVQHDTFWTWGTSDGRTLRLTINQIFSPALFERAFIRQLGRSPWDYRPREKDWHRFLNVTPIIIDQRKRAA